MMFEHVAMKVTEPYVSQELKQAEERGFELVTACTTVGPTGERAYMLFFKKSVPAKVEFKAEVGGYTGTIKTKKVK